MLRWCYNRALDEGKAYMLSTAGFEGVSASGQLRGLADYDFGALRHKDRKTLFMSAEGRGLAHDGEVCRFFGAVWIPRRGSVGFARCVGADEPAANAVLGQAARLLCGDRFVLLRGQLTTSDHPALMLELQPGADVDQPAVRAAYQRAYTDLLAWQLELLRGRPVRLDAFLQGRRDQRLQRGSGSSNNNNNNNNNTDDGLAASAERKALVRQYWTDGPEGEKVLLLAQQAAMRAAAQRAGRRVLQGVARSEDGSNETRAVYQFVASDKHPWCVLPLSQRQAVVREAAWACVARLVGEILLGAAELDDKTVIGPSLLSLVREADSSTRPPFAPRGHYATWAEILSPRDRYQLIADRIESGHLSQATRDALREIEQKLGLADVDRLTERLARANLHTAVVEELEDDE